jgi:tripartite-type tricarboxylate transporter receptor subunit TctC
MAGFLLQPHMLDVSYSLDDFRHIALLTPPEPLFIVVSPNSPIKTFDELLVKIKAGDRITYSFANHGGLGHLAMLNVLLQIGKNNCEFVPFSGSTEGLAAVMGGHIDFYIIDVSAVTSKLEEKQLIPLTFFSEEPYEFFPEIKPISEYGFTEINGFLGIKWFAIHKDTPDTIVRWLKQEVDKAIQTDAYKEFLKNQKIPTIQTYSEEEISQMLHASNDIFYALLKDLGMTKD